MIVARAFAGPHSSAATLDRDQSFHGTFVAGVIAGVPMDVPAGRPGFCIRAEGGCHPAVTGISGVAPRAYIGNYRVFNVPNPAPIGGCCSANSPEIVAAFEAAVKDGMDVINFSGGGPQADPRTDILIDAVKNVVKAGVVPVISAGNDRDFFGLGTAGSPATAPDAISVGAVANAHVFGPSMAVTSPGGLGRMPFSPTDDVPPSWITSDQRLVDVGTIGGANRQLCDANLPTGSLNGAIALVSRGGCPYSVKGTRARAAGAIGMVIVENRPGDPAAPVFNALSGGSISDLDGARIRAAGGAVTVRFSKDVLEVPTTWAGVPTSFSAGGLTPFGHALKPDLMAPGAQVLSSTLPEFAGDQFAVLDGTSFSAPHVSGAVALLTQRHPSWTPAQMKSALMSTAGPSFADTAGTQEASVIVEGAGLVRVGSADRPLLFTDPQSLSFGYLVAGGGANSKTVSVTLSDAGDGAGTWTTEIQSQVASSGATLEAAPVTLAPGGTAVLQITARAAAGAAQGDDFGFILLRRGGDVRRIPYAFSVSHSSLADAAVTPLKPIQSGDTRSGDDRVRVYRWPTSPFSILGLFGVDPSVNEDGKEKVYSLDITKQATNAGVVVVRPAPSLNGPIESLFDSNQPIHPWFMGSLDENDVLGYAGIPVNVNSTLPDFLFSEGAAGGVFLPPGKYYVSVDSGRDPFTGKSLAGPYTLALLGERREAARREDPHARVVGRAADHRREDHGREVGRRPALAAALLRADRAAVLGRGVVLRPEHGYRRLHDPAERRPAAAAAAVHAARRLRLPGGEEHQRGRHEREPPPEHPDRRPPRRCGQPAHGDLGDPWQGHLREPSPGAPRGRERQRPGLVGRVLRRQAPDRPRPQEHRRSVSHDRGIRAARAPTSFRPSRPTCAAGKGRRLRPFASAANYVRGGNDVSPHGPPSSSCCLAKLLVGLRASKSPSGPRARRAINVRRRWTSRAAWGQRRGSGSSASSSGGGFSAWTNRLRTIAPT